MPRCFALRNFRRAPEFEVAVIAVRLAPLFAVLFLSCTAASAANHNIDISGNSFSPSELTVQVGDTVTFRNLSGGVHNAVSDPGAANSFRCANGCDATGGNGAPSAANWTAVVTIANPGVSPYHCAIHGGTGGVGMSGTIIAEGSAPAGPHVAVDDLVRLLVNSPAVDVDVLANDRFDDALLAGGSLTIVAAPGAGTATVIDGGNGATVADDRIRYAVAADVAIDTTLTYRLCNNAAACSDGVVRVLARAFDEADLTFDAAADAGFADIGIDGLPALATPTYELSGIVPSITQFPLVTRTATADASPEDPWNDTAGRYSALYAISAPAGDPPSTYGVVMDAQRLSGTDIDLYMGPDLDGDGGPDQNEVRCTSAMSASLERCEMHLDHPGSGEVSYWVMVHNVGPDTATFHVVGAHSRLAAGDTRLVMTGPGHLPADFAAEVRLGWDDPTMTTEQNWPRFAFARLRTGPSTDLGWVPVRIDRVPGVEIARALVSGRELTIWMWPGETHERLYIDVPPGAQRLTVTASAGTGAYSLYVSRRDAPTHPAVEAAPPTGEAIDSDTSTLEDKTIVIQDPPAGRWYVTPSFAGPSLYSVTLRATLVATAPAVRSGSYFNPDRSGHGLFLYPAGNDTVWTVLWYHYFEDGSPTWYYLEGAAPGANGVFTSGVYRAAWDGDSNYLTRVGEATLTPSGPDAFTWSYTVDGQSGSEPLVALGRGCPSFGGADRDSSSTWFDPATAGTGYSVQLFPNGYEYNASFVYDGIGRPRYLAAERPGPAGALVETYALEQLTGFCPLCARGGAPTRQDVGTFTRTYAADGRLERVEVDAIYADGIPGAWTGDDTVQPLGGEETVQGCDP